MITSPLVLLALCASAATLSMALLWVLAIRIHDASHVDVAWAALTGVSASLYALLADGSPSTRALVAALGAAWGLRLGLYLLFDRVLGKPEDGRYRALREKWGSRFERKLFLFFQAQAGFVIVFSIPFLLACFDDDGVGAAEIAGAALWAVAWTGEVTADVQLSRWRARPENAGRTCRAGLWGWSRHPNYFFEWLVWVAFAVIALGSPHGWVALGVPALLLVLLFRVTGIPATEAQALRSRGEDYRRYRDEVPRFVPRPPRRTA